MSDVENTLRENRSIFNPTDMVGMSQEGQINPQMKVVDYLRTIGIDPEGPVSQLVEKVKGQMDKANPLNKAAAVAGQGIPPVGGMGGQAPPGAGPAGAPPAPPGMQGILNQM